MKALLAHFNVEDSGAEVWSYMSVKALLARFNVEDSGAEVCHSN